MLRLIVLMGQSGAGKSTFAHRLRDEFGFFALSADGMRLAMWGGCYPPPAQYAITRQLAWDLVAHGAKTLLADSQKIVIDGTNMMKAERDSWRQLVPYEDGLTVWVRTQFDNTRVWSDRNPVYDAETIRGAILSRLQEPIEQERYGLLCIDSAADLDAAMEIIGSRIAQSTAIERETYPSVGE